MSRFVTPVRSVLFVYLTAVIMTIGAERMFWFWSPELRVHLEVAAYYSIATAVGIGMMRRFNVSSWWSLMLVAPVMGFIVEGVITPVVYSGGPFVPIFPAWFSFWHGIFAFAGLVFGVRRLLLRQSMLALSVTGVGLGVFWAVWSATLWLPENVNDPELVAVEGAPLEILEPLAFTGYAALFTAVFVVAHFLLGFVWPALGHTGSDTKLARWEKVTIAIVIAGVIGWTVVIPWALPMFALYYWIQQVGLRWHRTGVSAGADEGQPSMLDQLHGRVGVRALLPLTLMAPTAAGVYAALWALDPSDEAVRILMYSTIAVQGIVACIVGVKALLLARSSARAARDLSASASSPSSASPQALSPSR